MQKEENKENEGNVNMSILRKLNENNTLLKNISENLGTQKQLLAEHDVLLQKIMRKLYPAKHTIDIFPIKSIQDLKNIDNKIENIPEEQLITKSQATYWQDNCFELLRIIFYRGRYSED